MACQATVEYEKYVSAGSLVQVFKDRNPVIALIPFQSERVGLHMRTTKNGNAVLSYAIVDLPESSEELEYFLDLIRQRPNMPNRPRGVVLLDPIRLRVGLGFKAEGGTTYQLLQ